MPSGDPRDAVLSLDGRRSGPGIDSPSDQASLFSLLGDETRLRILLALHEADRREASERASGETASRAADGASAGDRGLSFSELRRRCGVDDSGQFNYHLDQLTDRLVTKRDDRYVLTGTGERLVRTLLEGRDD